MTLISFKSFNWALSRLLLYYRQYNAMPWTETKNNFWYMWPYLTWLIFLVWELILIHIYCLRWIVTRESYICFSLNWFCVLSYFKYQRYCVSKLMKKHRYMHSSTKANEKTFLYINRNTSLHGLCFEMQ